MTKICCTERIRGIKKYTFHVRHSKVNAQLIKFLPVLWKATKVSCFIIARGTLTAKHLACWCVLHLPGLRADLENSLWHSDDCWHAWTSNESERLHSSLSEIYLLDIYGLALEWTQWAAMETNSGRFYALSCASIPRAAESRWCWVYQITSALWIYTSLCSLPFVFIPLNQKSTSYEKSIGWDYFALFTVNICDAYEAWPWSRKTSSSFFSSFLIYGGTGCSRLPAWKRQMWVIDR